MLKGDFQQGWLNYGWRLLTSGFGIDLSGFEIPLWEGQPIEGKTLFLWDEQGVGYSILYASMIPDLIEKNANVILQCDARLIPLINRSFPTIQCFAKDEDNRPKMDSLNADFHIPLGNLGQHVRPEEVAFSEDRPYLIADPDQTRHLRETYQSGTGNFLIGVAWHSKNSNTAEQKSLTLPVLEPVLNVPGITIVDLQYGDTNQQRTEFENATGIKIIHDDSIDQMKNIDLYASQTAAMDLVLTISNTTAHMAGSLGVPSLVMVRHNPLWYWMLEREDNPWYGSLKIFRQTKNNEWRDVVDRVTQEVISRVNL